MRDWVIPTPLKQPVPRRLRIKGNVFVFLLLLTGLSVPFLSFYFIMFVPEQQDKMLDTRGIDILVGL
jgi:hypothetical protein